MFKGAMSNRGRVAIGNAYGTNARVKGEVGHERATHRRCFHTHHITNHHEGDWETAMNKAHEDICAVASSFRQVKATLEWKITRR